MTSPQPNEYGIDDVALAQRVAELSDQDFAKLVADTRPVMPPDLSSLQGRNASVQSKSQQLCALRREMDSADTIHMGAVQPSTYVPHPTEGA